MKKYLLISFSCLTISIFLLLTQKTIAQNKITGLPPQPPPTLKLNDPLPNNLFVELARNINPIVVNISTSSYVKNYRDPMAELLEQFYGIRPQEDSWSNKPRRMGLGTGFIIREDGLIVTNAHVIRDADIIEVQLDEKSTKQYKAEIIGSDQRTDIALIKIKPDTKLTVASLGSSKDLEVGEWVAAFGNPYGHGHTMTKGIISSKGRDIKEINKFPLLQTDASINPGNSGGPLVNSRGQVIGVNSAIDARAQGIGFAIPIDEVKSVILQLEKRGDIKRGYLGINPQNLNDDLLNYLGFDEEYRASLVINVLPSGPADKAGIKPNDIITEIDGVKVKNTEHLVEIIADKEPGTKVKVKLLRNNRGEAIEKNIVVTIAEMPDQKKILRENYRSRR